MPGRSGTYGPFAEIWQGAGVAWPGRKTFEDAVKGAGAGSAEAPSRRKSVSTDCQAAPRPSLLLKMTLGSYSPPADSEMYRIWPAPGISYFRPVPGSRYFLRPFSVIWTVQTIETV